ncbi:DUF1549 and DUF1553 domain-containing protein [Tuwongella immobilis]|uniref:DUF1553 domain-containing protein n=1 Tax=Tuwongella immobilis TaxID=692036 RepID=A0A6C2YQ70_9BACT|nr:DUF1549 and DUF1553 domain-containing protein [Tuwongella immobilis]VIP03497.1 Uncharacterized protein OS=Singulisphaera acidiphila (strain ATCC BAA-1392 / DSM 18658 / VKM B-2454 / MOB10) GN=Sinac_1739 PE=4 SV=1: PSCyt2: PSD1 [Tuwongella immobilis]VTS04362.1 Uncharacterized protein OS=Singulisphaera acidiphila (strain ATCC BAA-1392 / DSM 18658 / VKM B-2454 / MOB10) GN=Sinac_1739 PE=4 SV=1: PSCyt2: PSD1 [Tuwongella immobilis]
MRIGILGICLIFPGLTSPIRAESPHHWAWQPLRVATPPAVREAGWIRTPVDAWILAQLESAALPHAPQADRRSLIRRITYDLIGLPPTSAEVDAFLADSSPHAWENLVNRLLDSPHYGERWARMWLDVARYADTKGPIFFEEAEFPWAWTYRDYVIESFNRDLSIRDFFREQLAADQLPTGSDRKSFRALGFLTLGNRFLNHLPDIIDDRIDVVSRGMLGLTVSCARCHDHKYDPIPTADYYSLYGVFQASVEPLHLPTIATEPTHRPYRIFAGELRRREQALTAFLEQKATALRRQSLERAADYLLAAQRALSQPRQDDFMFVADANDLNPTMILRWQRLLGRTRKDRDPRMRLWHELSIVPESAWPKRLPELLREHSAESTDPMIWQALQSNPPATLVELARRYATLFQEADRRAWKLADGEPLPEPWRRWHELISGPEAPPTVDPFRFGDLALLPDRPAQAEYRRLRQAVESWRLSAAAAIPRAHTLMDLPNPIEPVIFKRGNPAQPGETVPRQFLALLSGPNRQPFRHGSGRAELADAIVSPQNPLTARVFVNRVWQQHFGTGLVQSTSDFGTRSDPPSHPELLDWLAREFMAQGWSLKWLHRQIVMSATYQQSSRPHPTTWQQDRENRLLGRMPIRRLDWEMIQDSLRRHRGTLDPTVGGPSDRSGWESNRRAIYQHLDRQQVPTLWRTFDFASPDASCPRRDETTTVPQALFFLNHPQIEATARGVLARPEIRSQAVQSRLAAIFAELLQRPPSESESARFHQWLERPSNRDAHWQTIVQAILCSNEWMFLD